MVDWKVLDHVLTRSNLHTERSRSFYPCYVKFPWQPFGDLNWYAVYANFATHVILKIVFTISSAYLVTTSFELVKRRFQSTFVRCCIQILSVFFSIWLPIRVLWPHLLFLTIQLTSHVEELAKHIPKEYRYQLHIKPCTRLMTVILYWLETGLAVLGILLILLALLMAKARNGSRNIDIRRPNIGPGGGPPPLAVGASGRPNQKPESGPRSSSKPTESGSWFGNLFRKPSSTGKTPGTNRPDTRQGGSNANPADAPSIGERLSNYFKKPLSTAKTPASPGRGSEAHPADAPSIGERLGSFFKKPFSTAHKPASPGKGSVAHPADAPSIGGRIISFFKTPSPTAQKPGTDKSPAPSSGRGSHTGSGGGSHTGSGGGSHTGSGRGSHTGSGGGSHTGSGRGSHTGSGRGSHTGSGGGSHTGSGGGSHPGSVGGSHPGSVGGFHPGSGGFHQGSGGESPTAQTPGTNPSKDPIKSPDPRHGKGSDPRSGGTRKGPSGHPPGAIPGTDGSTPLLIRRPPLTSHSTPPLTRSTSNSHPADNLRRSSRIRNASSAGIQPSPGSSEALHSRNGPLLRTPSHTRQGVVFERETQFGELGFRPNT